MRWKHISPILISSVCCGVRQAWHVRAQSDAILRVRLCRTLGVECVEWSAARRGEYRAVGRRLARCLVRSVGRQANSAIDRRGAPFDLCPARVVTAWPTSPGHSPHLAAAAAAADNFISIQFPAIRDWRSESQCLRRLPGLAWGDTCSELAGPLSLLRLT